MKKHAGIYIIFLVVVVLLGSMSLHAHARRLPVPPARLSQFSQVLPQVPLIPAGGGQTSTGVSKPGGMPDIADMKSLPSYRFSIMTKMVEGFGAPVRSTI